MQSLRKKRTKWLWLLSGVTVLSLTGCGFYPSHPGDWPRGNLAWWGDILQFLSRIMDFLAHHLGGSYALALLVLTIMVRIVVLPFFMKQIKHTKVMQQLQPEIQKIRSKYKGDNQRIQQETMKLWQEHGANPMAGCLPMLIQLPVLTALFGTIEGNAGLNHSSMLWIPSLAQHDPYYILPILAGITTYFSSRVTMTGTDSSQKMMLYLMPIFIIVIGSRMAAALALYWTYSNVFTAVQGYFVKVRPVEAGTTASAVESAKKPKKVQTKEVSAKSNPEKRKKIYEGSRTSSERSQDTDGEGRGPAAEKSGNRSGSKNSSRSRNQGKGQSGKKQGTSGSNRKK